MRNKLTISLMLAASFAQAQYFQYWYNRSTVFANMSNETFFDGMRTRVNYAGGVSTSYYQVGYGATTNKFGGPLVTEEARFVRTNKAGNTASVNIGSMFANSGSTLYHNTHGRAICEIDNGAGTGGYLAVGNVESNTITGSTVPGGSDGLFYKMTNAGVTSSRFRFNVSGQADYFTDIIASTFTPGTYYICGYTSTAAFEKVIVASVTATGTVNWFRTYMFDPTSSPSARCRANGIVEDRLTGNLIVVGSFEDFVPPPNNGVDGLVFSLTSAGAVINAQSHHVFIDDEYQDIIQKANGDFAICGFAADGNTSGTAYHHIWLTEVDAACTVLSTNCYNQFAGGSTNTSSGYSIIERLNTAASAYEYYIAGPSTNSTGATVAAVSKINFNLGNTPVAWYNFTQQNNLFDGGYSIDYDNTAGAGKGFRLFSNTNSPLAIAPFTGSYIAKSYFNGVTCSSQVALPLTALAITMVPTTLPNTVGTVYARSALAGVNQNYVSGLICTLATVAGGVNTRLDDNSDEQELTINSIYLSPNPASDLINVSVNLSQEGIYTIEAIDVTGRSTMLSEINFEAGGQMSQVDISQLSKGVYTMIVRNENKTMTKKFVVQ